MLDTYSWQQVCVFIISLVLVLSGSVLLINREFLHPRSHAAHVSAWKLDIIQASLIFWVLAVSVLVCQWGASQYLHKYFNADIPEAPVIKTLIFSLTLQGPVLLWGLYA
ncbi:MAG TPA: hypothetical protein PLV25_04625, partial [Opitutales bacterium]|nr:hypothetical protein [Opitutales bacterium]